MLDWSGAEAQQEWSKVEAALEWSGAEAQLEWSGAEAQLEWSRAEAQLEWSGAGIDLIKKNSNTNIREICKIRLYKSWVTNYHFLYDNVIFLSPFPSPFFFLARKRKRKGQNTVVQKMTVLCCLL